MKILKSQQQKQIEWRLKAGEVWSNPDDFVFTNEIGQHLARPTVYENYKRIVRDIGLPDARFHDLRHSYAVAASERKRYKNSTRQSGPRYSIIYAGRVWPCVKANENG